MHQLAVSFRLLTFAVSAFLLSAAVLGAEDAVYRLISTRESGSVDLVEKTFDAAGNLILEMDPQTHTSVSSPGREAKKEQAQNSDDGTDSSEKKVEETFTQKIPMKVTSVQKYEEMFIQTGNLLQGENAKSTLGAWHLLENQTKIQIESTEKEPKFDLDQPLVGLDIKNAHINFFRPDGFLTRDELDVLNVQGNTLLADYILPNRSDVKIGESWKQSPDTMGILLQMDLVFNLNVKTTLTDVKKNIAILDTTGWIEGSSQGSTTKINLTGKAYFDLKRGRIVWFGLVIQEKRTAGFVSPGMDVTAKVQYKITPMDDSQNLTSDTISKISFDEASYGLLLYQDPGKAWKFVLTPDWEPMSQSEFQSNFRLLRDGDLIAQCSVAKSPSPKAMKPEEFASSVKEMLGENLDSILDVKTMTLSDGKTEVCQVDAATKYEEMNLRMIYYLITKKGKKMKQYTMVFTFEDNLTEKFAEANEQMIQSFSWVGE